MSTLGNAQKSSNKANSELSSPISEIKVGQVWNYYNKTSKKWEKEKILEITEEYITIYEFTHNRKFSWTVENIKKLLSGNHYKLLKAYNTPLYKLLNNIEDTSEDINES